MTWLTIDSAPKDGTCILLVREAYKDVKRSVTYGYWFAPEHGKYIGDCGGECRCPEYDDAPEPHWFSHDGGFTEEHPPIAWMPLPEPPEVESNDQA